MNSLITFRLLFPFNQPNSEVAITGSCESLGGWQNFFELRKTGFFYREISFEKSQLPDYFEFKFVVIDKAGNSIKKWEDGKNRVFEKQSFGKNSIYSTEFRGIERFKFQGVAVPIFSLRRKNGWGVGEFYDLKSLAVWCKKKSLSIIQILPINDTSSTFTNSDSYPYSAISSFALNPIFVNIDEIADKKTIEKYKKQRLKLDNKTFVDYGNVIRLKLKILREVFNISNLENNSGFNLFKKNNAKWLIPYSVFCCLRDTHNTTNFNSWGDFEVYSQQKICDFAKTNSKQVEFYNFIQYTLFEQLKDAVDFLHQNDIALKGDLPIGINRYSADTWQFPHLFNLDKSAGAPPDDFSDKGQNWQFPTYNWHAMERDNYGWWRSKFVQMQQFFDAFRIDHILGFFRIWEIDRKKSHSLLGYFSPSLPMSVEEIAEFGLNFSSDFLHSNNRHNPCDVLFLEDNYKKNRFHPRILAAATTKYKQLSHSQQQSIDRIYNHYFFERHNSLWQTNALKKLSELIGQTSMLVCGEDLGMLPSSVCSVMQELKILSLEIVRMPKFSNVEFVDTDSTPYFSVVSTGTHDMSTIRGWWKEDSEKRQRFFNRVLELAGEAPEDCSPSVAKKILDKISKSSSMLVILPIQDYLATAVRAASPSIEEERINDPSNPDNFWCYRIPLPIETLTKEEE